MAASCSSYLPLLLLSICLLATATPKLDDEEIVASNNTLDSLKDYNKLYDSDAFLLPQEEIKRRLGLIFERIDEDKDGFVTRSELKQYIYYMERPYIDANNDRVWKLYNPNVDTITWEVYHKKTHRFLDSNDGEPPEKHLGPTCCMDDIENGKCELVFKQLQKRDRRRWIAADQDLDDELTRDEFAVFLHPEDHPSMKDIVVVTEYIEQKDTDADGKISVDEYIADIHGKSEPNDREAERDRDNFSKRDLNGDGYLDREEVGALNFDNTDIEAGSFISQADVDGDKKLTKDEILKKFHLFVGTKVMAHHDEL